ncbi:MAG: hypothetical protein M1831_007007 [Alyxoria varia]|nr:MAG: hypothetical protein M1831_007007 [Alyxoria varia]
MASDNGHQAPVADPTQDAPPSKRDLASWWRNFKKNTRKEEEKVAPPPLKSQGIFGVPLQTSIIYANVAISLFDAEGRSFIYGYVPIVVAKCGVFLKDKATDVEGIFRLAGSERRIKDLQAVFNSPERYGKGLDWTGYNVHDAANVLRRYFRELPEPIIPLDFYERLREPLKNHQAQAVGQIEHQEPSIGEFDLDKAIKTYQRLITELPPLNRQLLLYILDLLAVFASKSDVNLMNAPNLSAIFQPGVLSHPKDAMSPREYRLSQDVLIFLIENQDHFIVGMQGTAADEKTIQDIQDAGNAQKAANAKPGGTVARSASNASAGAESVRRGGVIRRNVSVSSKRSRQSGNTPSPVTPPPDSPYAPNKAGGVHRSNTVPSRKSGSPAIQNSRFQREKSIEANTTADRATSTSAATKPGAAASSDTGVAQGPSLSEAITGQRPAAAPSQGRSSGRMSPHLRPIKDRHRGQSADRQLKMDMPPPAALGRISPSGTPSRERTISQFFKPSPTAESEARRRNKLQKKRPDIATSQYDGRYPSGTSGPPSPAYQQAQFGAYPHPSSNTNLESRRADISPDQPGGRVSEAYEEQIEELPPPVMQKEAQQSAAKPVQAPAQSNVPQDQAAPMQQPFAPNQQPILPQQQHLIAPSQPTGPPAQPQTQPEPANLRDNANRVSAATLKPNKSPAGSMTSRSTGNEYSSHDNGDGEGDAGDTGKKEKKHHRWRLSRSVKPDSKDHPSQLQAGVSGSTSRVGSTTGAAEQSTTSFGSSSLPRKSFTDESMQSSTAQQAPPGPPGSTPQSGDVGGDNGAAAAEREREKRGLSGWIKGKLHEKKERAKSPPGAPRSEQSASSRQSSSGVAPSIEGAASASGAMGKGKSMEQLPEESAGRYSSSSAAQEQQQQQQQTQPSSQPPYAQ